MADNGKIEDFSSCLTSIYNDDTEIFVYLAKKDRLVRGFFDVGNGRLFTFAFTSVEKAKAFFRQARKQGLLEDVDLLCPITVGLFFHWKETKFTTSDLVIDLEPHALLHPFFAEARYSKN